MPPGRPKKMTGDPAHWDVRLTPSDGLPIDFMDKVPTSDFIVFVACKEGGEGTDKRLHYHVFLSSLRSESWIRSLCSVLANGTGNPAYSVRKAHNGTIGYVVKEGNVVFRHGWTDKFLEEMLTNSQQYRKDLEAAKKRASRSKDNSLVEIMRLVAPGVTTESEPSDVSAMILAHYYHKELKFPTRSCIEQAVMTLLYPHRQNLVNDFYARNFVSRY